MLGLQQAAGNAAVASLLAAPVQRQDPEEESPSTAAAATAPAPAPVPEEERK